MVFQYLILASCIVCPRHNAHSTIVDHYDSAVLMGQHNLLCEEKALDFSNDNCHVAISYHGYTFPRQKNTKNSSVLSHLEFYNNILVLTIFSFALFVIYEIVFFVILNHTISIKTIAFISDNFIKEIQSINLGFFIFIGFFSHTFQAFDEKTGTFTVSDPSDFADVYKYEIKHIIIADGITEIQEQAFYYCNFLISAEISETVLLIGDSAFGWCNSLKNITIPGSVTSIRRNAFQMCSELEKVTLVEGVGTIGNDAFY